MEGLLVIQMQVFSADITFIGLFISNGKLNSI